ncbi:DUF2645 family protein [[Erwinia] mediterraneensis]|uniref:DUF2645 family protein n=1 Tax=[Erwinia] mediterraneensis TaxID=2161819 RepID=UPI0034E22722
MYGLFCDFNIAYLSYFKEERYIDGNEIKTTCDAYRVFMVDDIRAFTASFTLILILPFILPVLRRKHATRWLTLAILLLLLFWYWRFFGRLQWCV